MKSNLKDKQWSHGLTATAGLLGGLVIAVGALFVGVQSTKSGPLHFVTQQFLTTNTPWVANPGGGGPNVLVPGFINPWTAVFNLLMGFSAQNAAALPNCNVVGNLLAPVAPGAISYNLTTNPAAGVVSLCGLFDINAAQIVGVAPFNQLTFKWDNLIASQYGVICVVKMQNQGWNKAKVCTNGIFTVAPAGNPGGGGNGGGGNAAPAIDVQLQMGVNGAVAANAPLKYRFKVQNVGANDATNVTLKAYTQGLTNMASNGANFNGTTAVWQIPLLQANGGGVGILLEGFDDPAVAGAPSVVAELCTYNGDPDSKECNIVNLTPAEDDEAKA